MVDIKKIKFKLRVVNYSPPKGVIMDMIEVPVKPAILEKIDVLVSEYNEILSDVGSDCDKSDRSKMAQYLIEFYFDHQKI